MKLALKMRWPIEEQIQLRSWNTKHWTPITRALYKQLNIYMKRYKATVNAAGIWVETILYAQNQAQAYKLFQAIFGPSNVPHQPLQIG